MPELPTPSQTVGPFFNIGMPGEPAGDGPFRITGTVYDGEGEPVADALIESWQADSGTFHRVETDAQGRYELATAAPGALDGQAPHIVLAVFARGLLKHLVTRVYFAAEAEANAGDPVLNAVPSDRRDTLIAGDDGVFDIRLQGEGETVFFDV